MHLRRFAILSLAATLLAALTATAAPPAPATKAQQSPPTRHSLWSVKGKQNTVYLMGSVHVLKADSYPLAPAMEKAYAACSVLVLEIDADSLNLPEVGEQMFSRGLYTDGQTLRTALPESLYVLFRQAATEAGLRMEMLDPMKPGICAAILSAAKLGSAGYKPEYGLDTHFLARARADGKKLKFLETLEFQMGLFTGLSPALQEELLAQTLIDLDQVETEADEMIAAWSRGDAEKLDRMLKESLADYPDLAQVLLADRNARWVPQIEALLNGEQNCLVIVGAAHLVGAGSVVERLTARGYKVTQVADKR